MPPRRACAALLFALLCSSTRAEGPPAPEIFHHGESTLHLYYLDNAPNAALYPNAVCNDGSPGGFFFSNATDPAKAHLWLVYLEGGQWCWDEASCTLRKKEAPMLTSSKFPNGDPRWPVVMHMTGIFDVNPLRNPWAGANQIFVGYCSSDAWAGNIAAADNPLSTLETVSKTLGWHFRGQQIIAATMDALVNGWGLGSVPGHRLLFGGCSAGSRGAMFNLDNIAAMIPAGVELRGFFDSPLWVDVQPLAREVSLENETIAVYNLVNATGVLDQRCVADFTIVLSPGVYDTSQVWKCLYGQYRLPFVHTPFLVSASQFDKFQLPYNEGGDPPPGGYNGSALVYADTFQKTVRGVIAGLPTPLQPGSAVFSSACFMHCVSQLSSFWGVRIGEQSLKSWLEYWYFGVQNDPAAEAAAGPDAGLPRGASVRLVEPCVGFGCGQCHNKTYPPNYPSAATMFYSGSLPPAAAASKAGVHSAKAKFAVAGLLFLVAITCCILALSSAATAQVSAAAAARGGVGSPRVVWAAATTGGKGAVAAAQPQRRAVPAGMTKAAAGVNESAPLLRPAAAALPQDAL